MKRTLILISTIVLILIATLFILNSENKCEFVNTKIEQRNVILRVDDIQAYAWFDSQKKIIEDASKREIPLVLGVIPHELERDRRLWNLLKRKRCEMEIALHGYSHSDGEFANISYEGARDKLERGLKILNKIEREVITFIPPQDLYSNEAERAIKDEGFFFISGISLDYSDYGYTQTMYDWDNHLLVDYTEIIERCELTLSQSDNCIIVIHPQDFVSDGKLDPWKYSNYIGLLDSLKKKDFNIVTFRDLSL